MAKPASADKVNCERRDAVRAAGRHGLRAAASAWRAGPLRALAAACIFILGSRVAPAIAEASDANGINGPSIATSLPRNGDPHGTRKWLSDHGIVYSVIYTNDTLANLRGGTRRGAVNQAKLETTVSVDLEKLAGLRGLSFYSNAFVIHNTGRIRRDYVGGNNTISNIEAAPATRLSELWFEQRFWDDKASIRFGQLAADVEFFFAGISALFLQSDWAVNAASNLPGGGPSYPFATPGVRLKVDPVGNVSLLLAVYNGDPAGPGAGDEQLRNRHGLNFRVNDPPLVMAEAQWRTNHGKDDRGLASTLKFGGWAHFGRFDDQRLANDGTLLADPAGSGEPLRRRGNSGIYWVIEQQIYRPPGADAETGVIAFGRVSVSPSDRNLISSFFDTGVVFAGMIPGRPDDKFGASFLYARFSDGVRNFDRDQIMFRGQPGVIRDYEANLELTYLTTVVPGWTVQPVLTRVWHPNGDASRNAWVAGVRSMWRY